jgi:hypothetical protein
MACRCGIHLSGLAEAQNNLRVFLFEKMSSLGLIPVHKVVQRLFWQQRADSDLCKVAEASQSQLRDRPITDIRATSKMMRCGPSKRPLPHDTV